MTVEIWGAPGRNRQGTVLWGLQQADGAEESGDTDTEMPCGPGALGPVLSCCSAAALQFSSDC